MPAPRFSDRDATFMTLYPELFGNGPWHTQPSPICWGLQIGDGWMRLFDRLCEDLVQIIREDGLTGFRIHQVKEKFGGLRIHAHGGNKATWARINLAWHESMTVCERCGAKGRLGAEGERAQTLCEACRGARG